MKKLSLYIFLFFIWCNTSFAEILDQKKYVCKDELGFKTEISFLKEFNSSNVVTSTNLGMGFVLVNFALIENDNLFFFSVDDAFETITVGHIQSLKDNKRKYVSTTYGLNSDQSNLMRSNITRFNNAPDKIKTINLSEDEIKDELRIIKNQKQILDVISQEQSWGSTSSDCDVGKIKSETKDNSKPMKGMIQAIKEGCEGDNPLEKRKKFCSCYGDWFYDNLTNDKFTEFLQLSREDKIKFLEKNNIIKQCKFYSENYRMLDKKITFSNPKREIISNFDVKEVYSCALKDSNKIETAEWDISFDAISEVGMVVGSGKYLVENSCCPEKGKRLAIYDKDANLRWFDLIDENLYSNLLQMSDNKIMHKKSSIKLVSADVDRFNKLFNGAENAKKDFNNKLVSVNSYIGIEEKFYYSANALFKNNNNLNLIFDVECK